MFGGSVARPLSDPAPLLLSGVVMGPQKPVASLGPGITTKTFVSVQTTLLRKGVFSVLNGFCVEFEFGTSF